MGSVIMPSAGASSNKLIKMLEDTTTYSLSSKSLDGCIKVGAYTFYRSNYLTSMDIPYGVFEIGEHAFDGCSNLTTVAIPATVAAIGDYAFANCSSLTTIYYGGVQETWNHLDKGANWDYNSNNYTIIFAQPSEGLSFELNEDETGYIVHDTQGGTIGFQGNSLVIPSHYNNLPVVDVGRYFGGDGAYLQKIAIPSTVKRFSDNFSLPYPNLKAIWMPSTANEYSRAGIPGYSAYIGSNYNSTSTKLEVGRGLVNLMIEHRDVPRSVTSSSNLDNLEYIEGDFESIRDVLSNVAEGRATPVNIYVKHGGGVLNNSPNIGELKFGDDTVYISSSLNSDTPRPYSTMSSINLGQNLRYIGSYVFDLNNNPTVKISMPKNLLMIYGQSPIIYDGQIGVLKDDLDIVLNDDLLIAEGYIGAESTYTTTYDGGKYLGSPSNPYLLLKGGTPQSVHKDCKIIFLRSIPAGTLPDNLRSLYVSFDETAPEKYNQFDNGYYLGTTSNPYEAFIRVINTSITSCVINEHCRLSVSSSFYNCRSLESISLPNSWRYIAGSAFSGCLSLSSISIPDSVECICPGAFSGCTSLSSVSFGNNSHLVIIGDGAFSDCTNLSSINIPNGVEVIGVGAFSRLSSVVIPDSVRECKGAFNTRYLQSITGSLANVYSVCGGTAKHLLLNHITITQGEDIPDNSFYVTTVDLPLSIKSIGYYGLYGVTTVNYAGTMTQWDSIFKQNNWNGLYVTTTVHCTDGDIVVNS